jgi:hypothetical protein
VFFGSSGSSLSARPSAVLQALSVSELTLTEISARELGFTSMAIEHWPLAPTGSRYSTAARGPTVPGLAWLGLLMLSL